MGRGRVHLRLDLGLNARPEGGGAGPLSPHLPLPFAVVPDPDRPLYAQEARDQLQEDGADPEGHGVRAPRAVVHVEHEDGDHDGERDEDHGEEEVLPDEGDDQRGGRDDLGDEEEEHGEGEEDGDAEGDLLPAVGGQVEDQHGEEGDEQAGDDEVDGVEEGKSPDVEG